MGILDPSGPCCAITVRSPAVARGFVLAFFVEGVMSVDGLKEVLAVRGD